MVRALGKGFEQRNPYGFVVESRPGANTIIAANACKNAAPDGYTICLLSRSSVTLNPALYKTLSYDPLKDFEPITNLAFAQQVLILNKNVPVNDFKELVAYSKANPEQAQLRLVRGRRRHASCRRVAQAPDRRQVHPRALQGRGRCDAGVQGGRHPVALSDRRQSRYSAPDQRGRGQGPAGSRREAQSARSERAVVRRVRPAARPDRVPDLVRHVRAQGHAGARSSRSSTPNCPPSSRRRTSPSST